ncbi:hypothetical protein ACPB9J_33785 [Streptomyces lavendulocolor]|uniref:hypothetical protein n=1 Tax=Streptomyces lavendulocolor TaxID=67316 RepID=UPI003C2E964E
MEPSIDGRDLSLGDHLGLDATPDCCDEEMTAKPATAAGTARRFECGTCTTVLDVDQTGLVSYIR